LVGSSIFYMLFDTIRLITGSLIECWEAWIKEQGYLKQERRESLYEVGETLIEAQL